METTNFYTVGEAAEMSGWSESRLRQFDPILQPARTVGGVRIYDDAKIAAARCLRQQRNPQPAAAEAA